MCLKGLTYFQEHRPDIRAMLEEFAQADQNVIDWMGKIDGCAFGLGSEWFAYNYYITSIARTTKSISTIGFFSPPITNIHQSNLVLRNPSPGNGMLWINSKFILKSIKNILFSYLSEHPSRPQQTTTPADSSHQTTSEIGPLIQPTRNRKNIKLKFSKRNFLNQ